MKTLICFFLVLLVGVGGCKKDLCHGVVCQNGGHCENGVCVCDSGWSGANCSIATINIQSFVGDYHMVGQSQFWSISDTTYHPPSLIDDTMSIVKVNDSTLRAGGFDLCFTTAYWSSDTLFFYNYLWTLGNPSNYSKLSFHKPFNDDSAFYETRSGGLGGGYSTNLRGIKIH